MDFDQQFQTWYAELEKRQLSSLTFQEVRRALQALSSLYLERRQTAGVHRALETAGKRAAFALFYAPLHLLQVRNVVRELGQPACGVTEIHDLGCGTGASGIGWALAARDDPRRSTDRAVKTLGVDRNPWALSEAKWNYDFFALSGRTMQADVTRSNLPSGREGILLAFTVNEMEEAARKRFRDRLLGRTSNPVLVIEPIGKKVLPWWSEWSEEFRSRGGRADEWRFPAVLPERLRLLDKASGLDHRELTCRSLWLPGRQ